MSIETILIANRGEIACRVIRAARKIGIQTVAVYSDADANAPHVNLADQAVHIGASPVGESYLDIEKIIAAAKSSGSDAIHPGYGFLSENAEFARKCQEAGLIFIGPTPEAIDLMGDKAKAKRRMTEAGVPCVPGYQGDDQSDKTLLAEAEKIGLPIMVKASAGGGGRGMRLVNHGSDLSDAIKDARSEALNAFGSDVLILEKAVQSPRHVEIQVFADQDGNTIHLGERDCSVQRRHQKVLEEAPCPVMTDALRDAMGSAAVKAAKDIDYVGAGTVEFMLDPDGAFYFLEMNTRLQVEHPVTELVTGLDLVEWQIRVARGESLPLTQDDIKLCGHAIEARLYAEDPSQDFLPATGPVHLWAPAEGNGIRVDSGIETGSDISPFYDPMIAKVMSHGATRDEARNRLIEALKDTSLFGVTTNRSFLIDALAHPDFANGQATTAFIGENFDAEALTQVPASLDVLSMAAVIQFDRARESVISRSADMPRDLLNWSSTGAMTTPYIFSDGDFETKLWVVPQSIHRYLVRSEDSSVEIELLNIGSHRATLRVNDQRVSVQYLEDGPTMHLSVDGRTYALTNQVMISAGRDDAAGAGQILSPMHGALIELSVASGDMVTKGQRLAVLEAMKMQHEILADIDGTIADVHMSAGDQIAANTLMIEIEGSE